MAKKLNTFVDDIEDLQPSVAVATATAPAPTPTSPAPSQQTGPAPTPPPPVAPTATAAVTVAASPTPAPVEDDGDDIGPIAAKIAAKTNTEDFDVEFGDEKVMSKSDGLDQLRPEKGKTVRFALLTDYLSAKKTNNHYIAKKGTYHCLSTEEAAAVCCQKLGDSQPPDTGRQLQIVAPVLHYTNANAKDGRYAKDAPPIEWAIKFVRLSRSAFRRVSRLVEEDGKPTDIDIIMSHKDSGIGYEYSRISVARWKRNPELVKEVEAAMKPFIADGGKKLLSKLGKKVSVLEFRAIIAGSVAGAGSSDDADLSQVDDI